MDFILFTQPHGGDVRLGILVFLLVTPLAIKLFLGIIVQAIFKITWLIISTVFGTMLYLIWKLFSRKNQRLLLTEMELVPIENDQLT